MIDAIFQLDDDAFGEISQWIRRVAAPSQNERSQVDRIMRRAFAKTFSGQGGDTGWQPLAESTAADRRRLGFPARRPILIRTGEYMQSFTQTGGDHVFEVETDAGRDDAPGNHQDQIKCRPFRFRRQSGSRHVWPTAIGHRLVDRSGKICAGHWIVGGELYRGQCPARARGQIDHVGMAATPAECTHRANVSNRKVFVTHDHAMVAHDEITGLKIGFVLRHFGFSVGLGLTNPV